ncbi:MAG TPA: hypothetical protein VIF57_30325 [Polyangia bacterium]|jgi:hypothetical protein
MRDLARHVARWLAAIGIFIAGPSAFARDRLAVAIAAPGDLDLSDSLTEVAISTLAERRDYELVGWRELRSKLSEIGEGEGDIDSCLATAACLSRLCAAAGAARALIGDVRKIDDQFTIELAITDTRAAVTLARVARTGPGDPRGAGLAVRDGVRALLAQAESDAHPRDAITVAPEAAQPPATPPSPSSIVLEASLRRADAGGERRGARLSPYVSAGAGALSVLSLSAAVVTGSLAQAAPVGETRAQVQADLGRRTDDARVANTLFALGTALAITAAAALLWYVRHD